MVEITYQMVLNTLQTAGILVGIYYYVMTIRANQRNQELQLETRQAQLFMQIYNQWNGMEMGRQYQIIMDSEWTDYDDFLDKTFSDVERATGYRAISRFFEGIGVLVHRGLIDITFVDDLMSGATMRFWEKIAPIVKESRIRLNWPQAVEWVEYLYNQLKPIVEEQHPELKP